MELWSNPALSEFVIMFNSESVARTSLEEKCDKKLDEMPYKEGYDYNWNYMLSQWIVFYLSNKYLKPFSAEKPPNIKDLRSRRILILRIMNLIIVIWVAKEDSHYEDNPLASQN